MKHDADEAAPEHRMPKELELDGTSTDDTDPGPGAGLQFCVGLGTSHAGLRHQHYTNASYQGQGARHSLGGHDRHVSSSNQRSQPDQAGKQQTLSGSM